ncbi:Protein CONSERVED ONLY IN THE GREEN LINEAGE 160, chloroplastic [Linum perenne]
MPILNYFSVTSSATPISPDTPPQPPNPNTQRLPTKIILPSKNPTKWSTGVAPGDYGGPPLTTKLRRYWGGEGEDPLTSSDFIWNKDFMPRMKRLFQDPEDAAAQASPKEQEESSGFLSLHRVMSLDSMDIDLSKELAAPSKRIVQRPAETVTRVAKSTSPKWKFAPTQREQDKWDRATKAATGGSEAMFRELRKPKGDPAVLAAESREQYYKLKNKLQLLTVGIGSVGLVSAYVSYSTEITASFGVGFIGSLIYMRMLGKSIDSMADGAGGLIKGAIGQPRLLVPVALVMVFNRWNTIVVPEYGFVHLELIPMLVGFFTYKIATFAQAIEEALKVPDGNSDA